MRDRATEFEFLKWFYLHTDFGPADGDVQISMKHQFMDDTKKNLPDGYHFDDDGETSLDRD